MPLLVYQNTTPTMSNILLPRRRSGCATPCDSCSSFAASAFDSSKRISYASICGPSPTKSMVLERLHCVRCQTFQVAINTMKNGIMLQKERIIENAVLDNCAGHSSQV